MERRSRLPLQSGGGMTFASERRSREKAVSFARCGFERSPVHLDHAHHSLHGVGVTDQLADVTRHNLPAKAEAVAEPTAGHGFATSINLSQ